MNLLVSIFALAAMRPTETVRTEAADDLDDVLASLDEDVNSSKKGECECPAGMPICSHVEPCITTCSRRMTEPCEWKAMCTATLLSGHVCDCAKCPGKTKLHQAYIELPQGFCLISTTTVLEQFVKVIKAGVMRLSLSKDCS